MTDENDAALPKNEAPDDLSARQRAFCVEYLVDNNGTQAAIRAGYSAASAKQQASRLLAHPKIKANITAALEQATLDAGVKASDVAARLKRIAWSEPSETWRGADVLRALELLGKHLKMFAPEMTTTVNNNIEADTAAAKQKLSDLVMRHLEALRQPPPVPVPAAPATALTTVEAEPPPPSPPPASEERALLDVAAALAPAAKATVVRMRAPQNGSSLFVVGDAQLTPDANRLCWVPVELTELAGHYGFRPEG